ncbi:50S ribosomal protein L6 [Marinicauda algicola]|uniref:Large ribosomal subunit protein uL6 n=1 Tax=Marinicauda algicola TaxID=2029849 RepID=A0A4S2GVX6_9PROT|nr:50S ribosomal protein L6 [Marinicauda algicola]TGY87164.1 50S ribosomal protein L6 [Marinicauda algicola]
MSRLGKLPVEIPSGVTATLASGVLQVKGPKGELKFAIPDTIEVTQEDKAIKISPADQTAESRAMWGTARATISNMMVGVTNGFTRDLELVGVGYRAQMQGNDLKLALGLSHDVIYKPRPGIKIATPKPTEIKIEGPDKQVVGQTAAEIREFRPPEPYKGKGIKYSDEYIRRKEGKKK